MTTFTLLKPWQHLMIISVLAITAGYCWRGAMKEQSWLLAFWTLVLLVCCIILFTRRRGVLRF